MSGMLAVRDLTVCYGDGTVLSDINVSVDAGQAVCLLVRSYPAVKRSPFTSTAPGPGS